jgi:flagellar capping protein FliD
LAALLGESMKITKQELQKMIKEEMSSVLEIFGRDIEMPDHSNKGKYPELLEAIKEILDLSFGEGRYNMYKELQAMAEHYASNEQALQQADEKAAEEILSTRMGSYRGTTLPGGKKIK